MKRFLRKLFSKVTLVILILIIALLGFFYWGWIEKQVMKVKGTYLIYKGDHYHYIVRTKNEEDIHLHDEFLWNEEDYVSIIIPKESIKLTLKPDNSAK